MLLVLWLWLRTLELLQPARWIMGSQTDWYCVYSSNSKLCTTRTLLLAVVRLIVRGVGPAQRLLRCSVRGCYGVCGREERCTVDGRDSVWVDCIHHAHPGKLFASAEYSGPSRTDNLIIVVIMAVC